MSNVLVANVGEWVHYLETLFMKKGIVVLVSDKHKLVQIYMAKKNAAKTVLGIIDRDYLVSHRNILETIKDTRVEFIEMKDASNIELQWRRNKLLRDYNSLGYSSYYHNRFDDVKYRVVVREIFKNGIVAGVYLEPCNGFTGERGIVLHTARSIEDCVEFINTHYKDLDSMDKLVWGKIAKPYRQKK